MQLTGLSRRRINPPDRVLVEYDDQARLEIQECQERLGLNGLKNSDGERNIRWIEKFCVLPEGPDVGKPVRLRPWQQEIIRAIYDNPLKTRRVIITVGRKNAKTALSAFLLLLHLVGPERRVNGQLYSTALSRDQAAIIFSLAAKVVRMSRDLSQVIAVKETAKRLTCPQLGTEYRAMSAEATTAHGASPVFVVHDELGQVVGQRSDLFEAFETATAAQLNPLTIIISTQAPTDNDLLSILIDDAQAKSDPRTLLFMYTSDPEDDPFAEETIKKANPAFGDFQNRDEVLGMADAARRMPSREAEYRNLILNQRVEVNNPFISQTVWDACNGLPALLEGLKVYAGLDLSETSDLTALVLVGLKDGIWQVACKFWLPEDGLLERSRKDKVPYDLWYQQGYLSLTPGKAVEYGFVAEALRGIFDRLNVRRLAFDRWNFKHLKPWLEHANFSEEELGRFVEFGQGFQTMSPALRDFETLLLGQKIAHGGNPILRHCATNAVVQMDTSGNRKLNKAKSRGRIDGMIALTMALSVAATEEPEPEKPKFQMIIF